MKSWGSFTGNSWASVWYLGKNVNLTRQLCGLGIFRALCAAEDSELPLIMVQSIKSDQLVSLKAFGAGLLQQLFGNLNPCVLGTALISGVLLLQRTPPNADSMACLCKG